jgi:hypothetical protein
VADPTSQLPPIPLPTEAEAAALDVARGYFRRAGTHAATHLLGFPPLSDAGAGIADFSNLLLTSASLCDGFLDLADEHRQK